MARREKKKTTVLSNFIHFFLQQSFAEAAVPSPAGDIRQMGSFLRDKGWGQHIILNLLSS